MTRPGLRNSATVTVHIPMRFTIRGGRKTIVSDRSQGAHGGLNEQGGVANALRGVRCASSPQRTHNALIKALARAHRWRRQIESGEYASITELAKAQRVNESYACRMLRLTLLAPAIVVDILNGQHHGLMLKQIFKPFPDRWSEQTQLFGFQNVHR